MRVGAQQGLQDAARAVRDGGAQLGGGERDAAELAPERQLDRAAGEHVVRHELRARRDGDHGRGHAARGDAERGGALHLEEGLDLGRPRPRQAAEHRPTLVRAGVGVGTRLVPLGAA